MQPVLKIVLFWMLTWSVYSQTETKKLSFTLQEAIDYALQNNLNAKNANRELEQAKLKKWETTTMGLPQINAAIDYQNNLVIQRSVVPAEFFGGNPGEFIDVAFGTKHVMIGRATLSQLIFDGSYLVGLQAAKTYLNFYKDMQVKTRQEIKQQIIQDYTNILLLERSIELLEKNKKTLEKNYFEANQTFKNGLIEEESVEQIQITLSTINNSLNNSQRMLVLSKQILKIQLGLALEDSIQLTDNLDVLTQQNFSLELTQSTFDRNNNIDYILGEKNQEQMRLLLLQEKSKALPSLAANVNFGYNAFSNEFSFLNASQRWLNFSSVNVGLQIPIFSSLGRSSRTQQAKINFERAKEELTNLGKLLDLKFQQAKSDYQFSLEDLATNQSNLKLAERIEQKQQIKFKEGLSTSFEFAEAQRQLYGAQQLYLQSMINVINKKAALDNLLGN